MFHGVQRSGAGDPEKQENTPKKTRSVKWTRKKTPKHEVADV